MRVMTDLQHYGDIASAIRHMLLVSESVYPSQMASYVYSIRDYGGGGDIWNFVNHSVSQVPSYVIVDGQNVPVTYVGSYAFAQCWSISSIDLPECTSIGSHAFDGCNVTSVSLPLCTSVGSGAFAYCSSIASIALPACLSLEADVFRGCASLKTVDLPACTAVDDRGFYECLSMTSVSLPVCVSIGSNVFDNCQRMTSIELPMCTCVGEEAFGWCLSLTSVSLPACVSVGHEAFYHCDSLEELSLPVCEYIGRAVFYVCYNISALYLTSVSSVTTIEVDTFRYGEFSENGYVYVPPSLLTDFRTAQYWSAISSRILPWHPSGSYDTAYYSSGIVTINGANYLNGTITTSTVYDNGVLLY